MNRQEIPTLYHRTLVNKLKEMSGAKRQRFLRQERTTRRYRLAKEHVGTLVFSPSIKPILSEVARDLPDEDKTKQLVDSVLTSVFEKLPGQKDVDFLVRESWSEYNELPKGTREEKKVANDLVARTATQLLINPQDISIAENVWRIDEAEQNGAHEPEEPFSKKVKERMLTFIKEKEQVLTPEQFAGLILIYVNKDESQESARKFAGNLLKIYLNKKKSVNQSIGDYCNLVLGVFYSAGEDEVFREGMKIALYATDILVKDHKFAEQIALLYLPYKLEIDVLQNLLVSIRVVARACAMDGWNLEEEYRDWKNFLLPNNQTGAERDKRRRSVKVEKGATGVDITYNEMVNSIKFIFDSEQEPNFDEKMIIPKGAIVPLKLAFDPTNPLSKQFREFCNNRSKLSIGVASSEEVASME